jgi:hypothetical protein
VEDSDTPNLENISYNLLNNRTVKVILKDGEREEITGRLNNTYRIKLGDFIFDNGVDFK